MLSKKQILHFEYNGYVKFRYPNISKIKNLRKQLKDQINLSLKKNLPNFYEGIKKKTNKDDLILNQGMIELNKKDHELLVKIYNSISRSACFYSLITDEDLTKKINQLLGNNLDRNLYINSNTLRMDTPGKNKFIYGWHQDSKSNIEGSRFIQLWIPVIGNINKNIGPLEILTKSFKSDILTTHTQDEQRRRKINAPIRASYDTKLLKFTKKFRKKSLTCKLGQGILFHSGLMHKSGLNKTKNKMRYVMSCFFHDILNPNWKFKIMDQKKANLKY